MKRFLCLAMTVILMVFTSFPITAESKEDSKLRLINQGQLEIDDDGTDGYSGDYVVIYNPATTSYSYASTGELSGLIETEITGIDSLAKSIISDRPYKIDIDSELAENSQVMQEQFNVESVSFEVGDTHTFSINSSYCPLPNSNVVFEVLAKGEHCYIWTPTSTESNVYPLDEIDPAFAQICADEFDSKFDLMQSSFGNHTNGSQGDGRLNILYYNIDDGWTPGEGYVAGFFSAYDITSNGMPLLNIDTYPGVYYVNAEGETIIDVTDTYGTMVHEYQHLINYSECGYTETWLNESMSAAAEEICYPGSSIAPRIQSWMNYHFSTNSDWLNPPSEHEYQSEWLLHNGFSMYDWSNWMDTDDRLALYAQVSLYSQYLYTQYGNSIYRSILELLANGQEFQYAFQNLTGQSLSEFTKNFRIALVSNDPNSFDGVYGFDMQEGYDPSEYYGVENLYNWLSPIVFTGNSCEIDGGGAIVIKPCDGIFYPPVGADSMLEYYGITLNATQPEPIPLTDIYVDPYSTEIYTGESIRINAIKEPINANNYELMWTSSNTSVLEVSGNNKYATITGISSGIAYVTCTAHDLINDVTFTSGCSITVKGVPTIDDALNVHNGTLSFVTNALYPWEVDFSHTGRIVAKSSNQGVSSSSSTVSLTVDMSEGDTLLFDWGVSSEKTYDKLVFAVDGIERSNISGNITWTTVEYTAPTSKTYTFTWSYTKDSSVNKERDCGFLDNVSVTGYFSYNEYELGDVNLNGYIEMSDVTLIMRHAMMLNMLSGQQLELADYNGDGCVNIADATAVMRFVLGI